MKSYLWSKKKSTKDKKPTADIPNPDYSLRSLGLNAGWAYSSGTAHRAFDINDPSDGKPGTKIRAHRRMKILAGNDGVKNPSSASPGSNKPSNWILLGCHKKDGDGKTVDKKNRKSIYVQHLSPGWSKKHGGQWNVGDQVNPGDLIARMGITGNTSGPHLHCAGMWGWVNKEADRYLYLSRGDSSGKNHGYGSVVWGDKLDTLLRIGKNRKSLNSGSKGW